MALVNINSFSSTGVMSSVVFLDGFIKSSFLFYSVIVMTSGMIVSVFVGCFLFGPFIFKLAFFELYFSDDKNDDCNQQYKRDKSDKNIFKVYEY